MDTPNPRVMFDTNVFNKIIKEGTGGQVLPKAEYIFTNLQKHEISKTTIPEDRAALLEGYEEVVKRTEAIQVFQSSTPWNSPWDSPWDQGGKDYPSILSALELKKKADRGNSYDAVLIETCAHRKAILVSEDGALREVAAEFGVHSMSLAEYISK